MAAMCEIEIDELFGADTPVTNGSIGITRAERGVNNTGIVIAAEKDYRLSFKAGEFTKVSVEQGTVIRMREKQPRGLTQYFQVPNTATAKYSEMAPIIYIPATGGVFGDAVVNDVLTNPASEAYATLEAFIAAHPGPEGPPGAGGSDTNVAGYVSDTSSATAAALATRIGTAIGSATVSAIASVRTTDGSLTANQHNPVDASGAARAVTVADATAAGKMLSVEKTDNSANTVTVSLNLRGTAGTVVLSYQRETLLLVSKADGSWWPISGHRTKSSIDAQITSGLASSSTVADAVNAKVAGLDLVQGTDARIPATGTTTNPGRYAAVDADYRVAPVIDIDNFIPKARMLQAWAGWLWGWLNVIRAWGAFTVLPSGGANDQVAINAALLAHPLVRIVGDFRTNGPIKIPTGTTLILTGSVTLEPSSNCQLIVIGQDGGVTTTPNTKSYLIGQGKAVLDGTGTSQTRNAAAGYNNVGVLVRNQNGFKVSSVTIRNTNAFSALNIGATNGKWENIYLDQDRLSPNQDGIDFGPGCSFVEVDGVRGTNGDDVFSLFAKYTTSAKMVTPEWAAGGDTHDLYFRNVFVDTTGDIFRCQAAEGSKLYNIYAHNTFHVGTVKCLGLVKLGELKSLYVVGPYPATDGSDFYNLNFTNIGGRCERVFYHDSNWRDVTLRNVYTDAWTQCIGSSTADQAKGYGLVIDGFHTPKGVVGSGNYGSIMAMNATSTYTDGTDPNTVRSIDGFVLKNFDVGLANSWNNLPAGTLMTNGKVNDCLFWQVTGQPFMKTAGSVPTHTTKDFEVRSYYGSSTRGTLPSAPSGVDTIA